MILVAPTAFKGTISASDAARALADGARDALPSTEIVELPVSDGGPGLIDALLAAKGGAVRSVRVRDPLDRAVDARVLDFEIDGVRTAVIESADACGMHLLSADELDPLRLGTRAVGELILEAARSAQRVVLGLGGSATVDGGVGMATAFGWRFLDADGRDIGTGGGALRRLERIVAPSAHEFPRVVALADVTSPLTGALGAARVFAPQKGASEDDVELLDAGLARLADVIRRDVGIEVADTPGAGAAGGLGAGSVAFLRASLESGSHWLLRAIDFDAHLARATLLVTGEGRWDAQSSMGKVTGEVVARARRAGVPVLVVAGRVEGDGGAGVRVIDGGGALLDASALRRMASRAIVKLQ